MMNIYNRTTEYLNFVRAFYHNVTRIQLAEYTYCIIGLYKLYFVELVCAYVVYVYVSRKICRK